ncbi:MAG: GlsB/YeaQ/YmgE family stress response membrane protein [Aestuariivirga sp.]|nr:GlsB/YeaQ/YmgE family stress response membrane protein [Aestuariivirga sp.]
MEGFGWIMTIILGGLAGWIAEKVMKFDTGLIMNIVLGVVGALLGNWLLALAGIALGGLLGQLIVAVAGACILILAYRAFKGHSA